LSGELRVLIKEKGIIESQLAVLERKEAQSKWYKKRKISKNSEEVQKKSISSMTVENPKKITDLFNDMGDNPASNWLPFSTIIIDDEELS
jgi:hypothetical protein